MTIKGRSDDRISGRKSRSKLRGKSKPPAKDEYAFCHKKGHWKKDYPKLKNKDKDKSVANVGHNGDDDFEFSLTVSSMVCHSDEWILDSGCTYHMCPNREWFSSFQELDG